jgi:hypothetical protein
MHQPSVTAVVNVVPTPKKAKFAIAPDGIAPNSTFLDGAKAWRHNNHYKEVLPRTKPNKPKGHNAFSDKFSGMKKSDSRAQSAAQKTPEARVNRFKDAITNTKPFGVPSGPKEPEKEELIAAEPNNQELESKSLESMDEEPPEYPELIEKIIGQSWFPSDEVIFQFIHQY